VRTPEKGVRLMPDLLLADDLRAAAPQTRMLLASDGSTTILLQALVGQRLSVRVERTALCSGGDLAEDDRAALRIERDASVLLRSSSLVTAAREVVSRNEVAAPAARLGDELGRVMSGDQPIGAVLNAGRPGHRRLQLGSGWSSWEQPDGSRIPCTFKAYVILENAEPVMHIHERFNPQFVSARR
jgi:chorismate-pyruvate lyase